MLKKYNGFLVEKLTTGLSLILEGEIHAGGGFMSKLKEIQKGHGRESEIADKLIDVIESEDHFDDGDIKQNYFDSTEKEDMVSFILNNKIPKSWDSDEDASLPYNIKGRNEIKIGKVIRTIFDLIERENGDTGIGDISDKDIEKFVNAYKASKVNTKIKFKLVKGDEIAEYYNEGKYYSQAGTLGGSCMKDEGEDYFELYTKNTRKVRLLIYVDDNDVVYGRAIVWKLSKSPCEAQYFMDRVYVNRDSDEIKFKKFAEEKGWLYKRYMNAHIDKNVVFMYKGKEVCGEIQVKLDGDCDEYPFVDTLCFYGNDHLSNLSSEDYYFLHSVSGECEECDECHGRMTLLSDDIDELVSSEDYEPDITLCSSCCEGHIELLKRGIRTKYNGLK